MRLWKPSVIVLPLILIFAQSGWSKRHETSNYPTKAERVALALEMGSERTDQNIRRSAIITLDGLGAHPVAETEPNVAKQWAADFGNGRTAHPLYRGRILGPVYQRQNLAANSTLVTDQLFIAGQAANIAVAPIAYAKLSLVVRDATGAKICEKAHLQPSSGCSWIPVFSQRYQIEVNNPGRAASSYFLVID
jgi:hypothetical protein